MIVGIDDLHRAAEAVARAAARLAPHEGRPLHPEVFEHPPEQLLGQAVVADLVGVAQGVLGRRLGPAHGGQFRAPQPQCVADIVEAERVTDLGVEHRHHVAPRLEGAGLPVGPRWPEPTWAPDVAG
jgi:hypothetical protein